MKNSSIVLSIHNVHEIKIDDTENRNLFLKQLKTVCTTSTMIMHDVNLKSICI